MLNILYYLFSLVICAIFLVISAVVLVITYPFQKSRRMVHEFSRILVRILLGTPPMWRHRLIGLENVDRKRSYVVVLNHRAWIDIPALYYLPLNFRWVSKREVLKVPYFGQFLSVHGDICINRGNATQALDQLLREGKMWISRGASVAIFPEGTRSKDGDIHRFKTGAFMLAREAGVEILPVVLDGTWSIMRSNYMFNWRNTITMRVLPSVSAERVVSTDMKDLMAEVHDSMTAALSEMRNENKK